MSSEAELVDTVIIIREESRQEFNRLRKEMRYKVTTVHRSGLDSSQPRAFSPVNLNTMAATLRKRKGVDREFLADLSQALAESEQNSTIFFGIDGSAQSLCTYLTGGDSSLQLEAAYCVANAATWEGENTNSSLLATVTGAYMITLLGSGNCSLQEACCWALGNMLPQGKNILCAQGFVDKVLTLFDSPIANVRTAAVQCLVQFVSTCLPTAHDLNTIAARVDTLLDLDDLDVQSLCWLIYLLSFFPTCDVSIVTNRIIFWCLCQLRKQLSEEKKIVILIPLVRFLGNVCAAGDNHVITLLGERDFTSMILQLLNSSYEPICKETLLLVANIVNNSNSAIHSLLANVKFKESLEKSVGSVSALF